MNILIFYVPRSKSTMIHNILTKKFNLTGLYEPLTFSRRENQNFSKFPEVIETINTTDNICMKLSPNDFIDLRNNEIRTDYKTIDFTRFDRIIFTTRDDYLTGILSYAYMDMQDRHSWHRQKGENKIGKPYLADLNKMFYMLRGYAVHNLIRKYIETQVDPSKILRYEFDTAEVNLAKDFDLTDKDFDINIVDNKLDYKLLATNYPEIRDLATVAYPRLMSEVENPTEYFWQYTNTIL